MAYYGKLYGKLLNKYFDTGKTTHDYDELEKSSREKYFNFAKYLAENYEYTDSTADGDKYNHVVTGLLKTEVEIFNEWQLVYNKSK